MKTYLIGTILILVALTVRLYVGFTVGTEKMWANANVYFASGQHSELERRKYSQNEDGRVLQYEQIMRNNISKGIQIYGRYKGLWISRLNLGLGWDNSTDSIMKNVISWYQRDGEVDYYKIEFEDYWKTIESQDPEFFKKLELDDPEEYENIRSDSRAYLENIKSAIKAGDSL